ncbi:phosphatase PAP2 family protein [Sphingomonas sp. BK580]|uniref:phosphatase PAP2 family protein n=1 Tax=Sphingomonas sp. BK580 TaxID=2586972 RepID=UPI0016214C9C|nr:phosphatase PAP2 family protein [Sphingomonas sp. BK580]MBB3695082.1 membrane-associated phospholipid phosphatase [Sphingomonas sp. BK580]
MGKKKAVERAAAREHDALAPVRALAGSTAVRALTPLAKATDEPPLLALGLGTLALGAVLRRPVLARSGARMVTSHLLATGLKTVMKASVDRVRPNAAGDHPTVAKGHGTDDTTRNAFPSGHTAGAVAIAEAVRREVPGAAVPARLAAGAAGALQVTRGAHYASDVVAGAAIGWLSERLASWAMAAVGGAVAHRTEARAEAETEAHPS